MGIRTERHKARELATDTLYSLSDNKASAAELFVDLFTKRKETYTHMASVMDHIIQIILKDGGIDN